MTLTIEQGLKVRHANSQPIHLPGQLISAVSPRRDTRVFHDFSGDLCRVLICWEKLRETPSNLSMSRNV
jgi:hypothetical protein